MASESRIETWRSAGEEVEFRGRQIFLRRQAGEGRPILLLHGFPTCSFDFRKMFGSELPGELNARPLIAPDFLGFGLSEKPRDHTYTLSWQADLVHDLVQRFAGGGPVTIVAHDMGTSIATELMAREIDGKETFAIDQIVLFNGSILLHLAQPILGQRLLRSRAAPLLAGLSNRWIFANQLGSVFSRSHPLSAEEAADQWALISHLGGHRLGHKLIHYMDEREQLTDRWHGAVANWPGDLRLLWALEDPVAGKAVLSGLRTLRPTAPVAELPGLGHYPQVEDPALFCDAIAELLAR